MKGLLRCYLLLKVRTMANGRRGGRKTDFQWLNTGDDETGLAIPATILGSTGIVGSERATIHRIRGTIGVQLDAAAVDERCLALFGLMLMNSDAFTDVGVTAVPELFSDSATSSVDEGSWIWQGQAFLSALGSTTNDRSLARQIDIDTKAMRKWGSDQTLVVVCEVPAELYVDQSGTLDFQWFIHVLIGR